MKSNTGHHIQQVKAKTHFILFIKKDEALDRELQAYKDKGLTRLRGHSIWAMY